MPVVGEKLATARELQANYSRLFEWAAKGPVCIQQRGGKPAVTLISRDIWQNAIRSAAWLTIFSAVVAYTVARVRGLPEAVCPAEFSWLRLYKDDDDLRTFVNEFSEAILRVGNGLGSWDEVDSVVEVWSKSAALLENKELMARLNEASKEVGNDVP